MEKFKSLQKIVRSTLAGATMLGTVGAVEVPMANSATLTEAQSQESINVQRDATVLVNKIIQLKPETNDALGGYKLYTKQILPLFDAFVKSNEVNTLQAAQIIAPELQRALDTDPTLLKNPGVDFFRRAIAAFLKPSLTPEQTQQLQKIFGN